MKKEKKKNKEYEEYEATLIGKDGFSKAMIIKEPSPMLFIPEQTELNVYLENLSLYPDPPKIKRRFMLDRDESWGNKLIYREI